MIIQTGLFWHTFFLEINKAKEIIDRFVANDKKEKTDEICCQ